MMAKFTTTWLTTIFPDFRGNAIDPIEIVDIYTDSRQIVRNGLFVPIVGEKFDGHVFIKEAIQQGAVAAIWQKDKELPSDLPAGFPVFLVDNTIEGLQILAKNYRKKVNPIVFAITGSNGKTTTKDLFATVFQGKYRTWKTQGNLNNHIGLPLTILQMQPDTEILIAEMGMNHFGEIEVLSRIAQPNFGVITNIGESHIEFLGSRKGIAKAKSEIIEGLDSNGKLFIDGDEPLLQPLEQKVNVIRIGFHQNNDYIIKNIEISNDETKFELDGDTYHIPALGRHQAKNTSYAIVAAKELGLSTEEIQENLKNATLTKMRFEKLMTDEGTLIINDAYNASATSMKASIEVIKEMNAKRKIIVLGDILELGSYAKEIHRSVADAIDDSINAIYTYGNHSEEIGIAAKDKLGDKIECYHTTSKEDLVSLLMNEKKQGNLILFKASRGMKLEEAIHQLIYGEV
jgi:UDP-N-acetylmuramoyl-tripeptide--D-alanyl-D-alanine ligase